MLKPCARCPLSGPSGLREVSKREPRDPVEASGAPELRDSQNAKKKLNVGGVFRPNKCFLRTFRAFPILCVVAIFVRSGPVARLLGIFAALLIPLGFYVLVRLAYVTMLLGL